MNLTLHSSDFFSSPQFSLKVIERDPELPYPLHSHDFYELVIIVSGKGDHITSGNTFPLFPGNVFVISPGLEHGYQNVNNLHLYNILFTSKIFIDSFPDLRNMPGYHALMTIEPNYRNEQLLQYFMQLTPSQMGIIMPIVENMQKEADSIESDDGSASIAMSLMVQLLVILFRYYSSSPRKDNTTILRIADAISFLEAHTNKSISIKELIEITNMSVSTLNRHFQNATGLSPIEYHIQLRIEEATRYIRSTDLNMNEISEATGFSDANYFSRQFRKVMGMSPREYKKNKSYWYQ